MSQAAGTTEGMLPPETHFPIPGPAGMHSLKFISLRLPINPGLQRGQQLACFSGSGLRGPVPVAICSGRVCFCFAQGEPHILVIKCPLSSYGVQTADRESAQLSSPREAGDSPLGG